MGLTLYKYFTIIFCTKYRKRFNESKLKLNLKNGVKRSKKRDYELFFSINRIFYPNNLISISSTLTIATFF